MGTRGNLHRKAGAGTRRNSRGRLLYWLAGLLAFFLLLIGLAGCAASPAAAPPVAVESLPRPTETVSGAAYWPAASPTDLIVTRATPLAARTTTPPTAAPSHTSTATTISQPSATPPRLLTYVAQAGDTLESIAQQHGLSATTLANANFLADANLITAGQLLVIPFFDRPSPGLAGVAPANTNGRPAIIGYSLLERPIEVYTFGQGENEFVFVGGVHGGYEWNSTLLAYQAIDYFTANPERVPPAVTLHIIPTANPDGLYAVTGKTGPFSPADIVAADTFPARFNANGVDLNRNWDCDWSAIGYWYEQVVSGGNSPFSEVETQLLRDFFEERRPRLRSVVFWHSQAGLVSAGRCDGRHPASLQAATLYAQAANYPMAEFSTYEITGDASNWLAGSGIPSFTVELFTHEATDWARNRAGMLALLANP